MHSPISDSNTVTYIYRLGIMTRVYVNITIIISGIVCFLKISKSLETKFAARCVLAENLVCSDLVFSDSKLSHSDLMLIIWFRIVA
jgi:hypothetical protein